MTYYASAHHSHLTLENIQLQIDALGSFENARAYGEEREWREKLTYLLDRRNAILGHPKR